MDTSIHVAMWTHRKGSRMAGLSYLFKCSQENMSMASNFNHHWKERTTLVKTLNKVGTSKPTTHRGNRTRVMLLPAIFRWGGGVGRERGRESISWLLLCEANPLMVWSMLGRRGSA